VTERPAEPGFALPREFVAAFVPDRSGRGQVVHRWGQVTAVTGTAGSTTDPPRLTVRVSGEAENTVCPYMVGPTYAVGDTVRVVEGVTRYVDGKIAR
jgi:hypothetical protein